MDRKNAQIPLFRRPTRVPSGDVPHLRWPDIGCSLRSPSIRLGLWNEEEGESQYQIDRQELGAFEPVRAPVAGDLPGDEDSQQYGEHQSLAE